MTTPGPKAHGPKARGPKAHGTKPRGPTSLGPGIAARAAASPASGPDARPPTRPVKHSLTLRGHRTSVSLEEDFWRAFREIAAARGQPLNALAAEIDEARGLDAGLASAIRLFVLRYYRDRLREG